MDFVISDTFSDSLARLNNEEQKLTRITAFDLQMNPAGNGNSFHKLDRAKDPNFWSVRVSSDLRLIVHRTANSLMLCYVDHHDKAYEWAAKRKIEHHPQNGKPRLIVLEEVIREIIVHQVKTVAKPMFEHILDEDLIKYGVPDEYVSQIKQIQDEDTLFKIIGVLPNEAGEALLELATGNTPPLPEDNIKTDNPFEHPDAKRHFRIIKNKEQLEQAFEAPWEKWIIFLHPAQQQIVDKKYSGPARVSGSAGTGKTVVALHRAVALARNNPDARVLLTTFTQQLANALKVRLKWLLKSEPALAEQIDVHPLKEFCTRLYRSRFGKKPTIVSDSELSSILHEASEKIGNHRFTENFIAAEWREIVDTWRLKSWEDYRDVSRLGRKTRLPEAQRKILWEIFELVIAELQQKNLMTIAEVFEKVTENLQQATSSPIDFAVVDEAQDLSVPELKFLSVLGKNQPDSLFFAGDSGQRIFQPPFSWRQLGVSIRGRSSTLKINYRTSHQIRVQADRLLPNEVSDVDGNVENRKGTISIFDGPAPDIRIVNSCEDEIALVAMKIKQWRKQGIAPESIGVFVRSKNELERALSAVNDAGEENDCLDDFMEPKEGCVVIGTMHQAKGLEFKSVIVMACDEDAIPSQERMEAATDDSDLEDVYNTERYLLYVACTRARENLLITAVDPGSEFLDDLLAK